MCISLVKDLVSVSTEKKVLVLRLRSEARGDLLPPWAKVL